LSSVNAIVIYSKLCYNDSMKNQKLHPIQEKILRIAQEKNLVNLSLREIGELVGDRSPQKIKHHLEQLSKKGLLTIDRVKGVMQRPKNGWIEGFLDKGKRLLRIPIVGSANCGSAELLAESNIIGYLRISNTMLNRKTGEGLFAVRADGFSMNNTSLDGKTIDNGDYVIVDSRRVVPEEGKIILSIIDGAANIKRFHMDKANNQIVLMSDSIEDLAPIYIHPSDDYIVSGTVIDVIKKPSKGNKK